MAKLIKQKYRTLSGEVKTNCYRIMLTKEKVAKAGINENDDLEIKAEHKRIIIKKKEG